MIERDMPSIGRDVATTLKDHGEANPVTLMKIAGALYDADQVLGDWLPEPPS